MICLDCAYIQIVPVVDLTYPAAGISLGWLRLHIFHLLLSMMFTIRLMPIPQLRFGSDLVLGLLSIAVFTLIRPARPYH